MRPNDLNLGDQVKDIVTGYKGVVVCKSEHLNGCWRVGVQAPINKEGKVDGTEWFDIETIVVLKTKPIEIKQSKTGGPKPKPKRRKDG